MLIAAESKPLWVLIPGYIAGGLVVITAMGMGLHILMCNADEAEGKRKYPNWLGYLLILLVHVFGSAYVYALASKDVRTIGEFAEVFITICLFWAAPLGGLAAGFCAGMKLYARGEPLRAFLTSTADNWRTRPPWLAVLAVITGVIVGLTVALGVMLLAHELPCFEKLMDRWSDAAAEAEDSGWYD